MKMSVCINRLAGNVLKIFPVARFLRPAYLAQDQLVGSADFVRSQLVQILGQIPCFNAKRYAWYQPLSFINYKWLQYGRGQVWSMGWMCIDLKGTDFKNRKTMTVQRKPSKEIKALIFICFDIFLLLWILFAISTSIISNKNIKERPGIVCNMIYRSISILVFQ